MREHEEVGQVAASLREGPIRRLMDAEQSGWLAGRDCLVMANDLLELARLLEASAARLVEADERAEGMSLVRTEAAQRLVDAAAATTGYGLSNEMVDALEEASARLRADLGGAR